MLRIGVDIGGTFTDFAIWKNEGDGYVAIGSRKAPTSRPNLATAVTQGVADIVSSLGRGRDEPILVIHGTTVSTNAVIERSEPRLARAVEGYSVAHGPARRSYEAVWPVDASAALANAVLTIAPGFRRTVLTHARAELTEADRPITPAEIAATVGRLTAKFGAA